MPNKAYAREWLAFARRHLETATLLYEANHYGDVIVIEAQQAMEKSLKALLALDNVKIPRSHDLGEIAALLHATISFREEEKSLLERATDYYKEDRYPNPRYSLPSQEEVESILAFARQLHEQVAEVVETAV